MTHRICAFTLSVVIAIFINLQELHCQEQAIDSQRVETSGRLSEDSLRKAIKALKEKNERLEQLIDKQSEANSSTSEKSGAATNDAKKTVKPASGVPVVLFKDTVFFIYAKVGAFSAADRAERAQAKLEKLADDRTFDSTSLVISCGIESCEILCADIVLVSISEKDALQAGMTKEQLAESHSKRITKSLEDHRSRNDLIAILIRIVLLLVVIAIFFFGVKFLNKAFTFLNKKTISKLKPHLRGIVLKNYEFLSARQELIMLMWCLKVLKWIVISLIVYLSLPAVFSIFPTTKGIATTLIGYVLNPIQKIAKSLIGFVPELITIAVIVVVTIYFIRFLRFLKSEVENEKLKIPGFYPDWAQPTFSLLKVIIYLFSFIVIFPYLPGSDSPVFQGVSVFLGLLISLGSSSAIGNIIAGLVITYMRPFKLGDRVSISGTVGDVIEKTMLVTRIRTIKNEDVTIPNSAILSGSTTNYSSSAQALGLILNTTLTIGYDVSWRKVHELLIQAAKKTKNIQHDPAPFVLQTSLDDFYVSYQINAYTSASGSAAVIYSELYAHILDLFNENGVEIMSPHYRAVRDGNSVTLPSTYIPPDYESPGFKVKKD